MNAVFTAINGLANKPVEPGASRMRRFCIRAVFRAGGIDRRSVSVLPTGRSPRMITLHATSGVPSRKMIGF